MASHRPDFHAGQDPKAAPEWPWNGAFGPGPMLAGVLRPQAPTLMAGSMLSLLQAGLSLCLPLAAGLLAVALAGGTKAGAWSLGLLLGLFVLHSATGVASRFLLGRAEAAVATGLRQRLYERLQALPLTWFDRRRTGDLLGLFTVDAESVAGFAARAPVTLLPLAITALGALIMTARIDLISAGALIVMAPALALVLGVLGRPAQRPAANLSRSHGQLLATVQENLENLLTVKVWAREPGEAERHRRQLSDHLGAREAHLRHQLLAGSGGQMMAGVSAAGLLALAALRPGAPPLAVDELVRLLLYALLFTRPLLGLGQLQIQLLGVRAAIARLAPLWEVEPERPAPSRWAGTAPGEIHVQDVDVSYPGRPAVLRDASLRIAGGECVALLGANGQGKTTLAHLIAGLLSPDNGRVSVGGSDPDTPAPRHRVGLATQQVQLFDRTVRDNIAYARPASLAEVQEAAVRAGADRFIRSLPRGYDTPVGERGARLSGGQRQRLALARAILARPGILILDEAMSMLEPDGERRFLEENRAWLQERTVILITHRVESLAFVDRILRVRDGRVVSEYPDSRGPTTRARSDVASYAPFPAQPAR